MRGIFVLAMVMLSGCQREPSFDERYKAAERKVQGKAQSIDAELQAREDGKTDAGLVPGDNGKVR